MYLFSGENKGALKDRKQRAISSTDIYTRIKKDEKVRLNSTSESWINVRG
jgi:hypothetical protein